MSAPYPLAFSSRRVAPDYLVSGPQTVFGVPFPVYAKSDLLVALAPPGSHAFAQLTLNVDYTVALTGPAAAPRATVTLAAVPASMSTLRIEGLRQPQRTTSVVNDGIIQSGALELELDQIEATLQELRRDVNDTGVVPGVAPSSSYALLGRVVRAPLGESLSELPAAATRAGKLLGFDGGGNPSAVGVSTIGVPVSSFMQPALNAGSGVAFLEDIGVANDVAPVLMSASLAALAAAIGAPTLPFTVFSGDPTGNTDCSAAFAAWAASASTILLVPPGIYLTYSPWIVPSGKRVVGAGSGVCSLSGPAVGASPLTIGGNSYLGLVSTAIPSTIQSSGIAISGLTLALLYSGYDFGLMAMGCAQSEFRDIVVTGAANIASVFVTCAAVSPGFKFRCEECRFDNVSTSGAAIGVLLDNQAGDGTTAPARGNLFTGGSHQLFTGVGVKIAHGQANTLVGVVCLTTQGTCFDIADGDNCLINPTIDRANTPPIGHVVANTPNIYGVAHGDWLPPTVWQASHLYTAGAIVSSNGYRYVCSVGGTSASSGGPGFALYPFAAVGSPVPPPAGILDGTVTWSYAPPDPSTYITGVNFHAGASGCSVLGWHGNGCYEQVTADNPSVFSGISIIGRFASTSFPAPEFVGPAQFSAGDYELSTLTPSASGMQADLDSGGYNGPGGGQLAWRWTWQNGAGEIGRVQRDLAGVASQILLGKTTVDHTNPGVVLQDIGSSFTASGATPLQVSRADSPGGSITAVEFYYGGSTLVGSIAVSSTATSFLTTSDERVKTLQGAADVDAVLARVLAVPVHHGRLNGEHADHPLFLAHELQEQFPHLVVGEKDGEEMMMVDGLRAPPAELIACVQALAGRLAAAEAKIELLTKGRAR